MNFDDNDVLLDLIGVDEIVELLEEKVKKVLIIIVIGLYCYGFILFLGYIVCFYKNFRIFWSWENYIV